MLNISNNGDNSKENLNQQWNGYTLISKEKKNKDGNIVLLLKSKPYQKEDATCIRYVLINKDGEHYGDIILKKSIDDLPNEVEIEYYANTNQNVRNRGNISIGLNEVLSDVFTNITMINKVYLNIAPKNIASQKVAQHCGVVKKANSRRYYEIFKEKYLKESKAENIADEIYVFTEFDDKENIYIL